MLARSRLRCSWPLAGALPSGVIMALRPSPPCCTQARQDQTASRSHHGSTAAVGPQRPAHGPCMPSQAGRRGIGHVPVGEGTGQVTSCHTAARVH